MRVLGPVTYIDGAKSFNFSIPVSDTFPAGPHQDGEFWILSATNTESRDPGLYVYDANGTDWLHLLTLQQTEGTVALTYADDGGQFTFNTLNGSDTIKVTNSGSSVATLTGIRPKVQLKTTSTMDINTAAEVSIPWNTQQLISTSMFTHSTTVNNTQITVLKAGVIKLTYMINYTIQGTNKVGSLKTYAKKNGTQITETISYSWIDQGESPQGTNQCSVFVPVAANDVITLWSIRNGSNPVINIRPAETTFHLSWYEQ